MMYETIQSKHTNIINEHKEKTVKTIRDLKERLSASYNLNKKVETQLNDLKVAAISNISNEVAVIYHKYFNSIF